MHFLAILAVVVLILNVTLADNTDILVVRAPILSALDPWVPAHPSDQFRVKYLLNPLMKEKYGNITSQLGAYHAAIGFEQINGPRKWTLELVADHLDQAVIPDVDMHAPIQDSVKWQDHLQVYVENHYDATQWDNITDVATVDGTMLNEVYAMTKDYNTTMPYYRLLGAAKTAGDLDPKDTWISANNCQDYAEDVLKFMQSKHVTWTYTVRPTRDYIFYIGAKPVECTMNSPYWAARIRDYFEIFHSADFKSIEEVFAEVAKAHPRFAFIVDGIDKSKYYAIPWHDPYVEFLVKEIGWMPEPKA